MWCILTLTVMNNTPTSNCIRREFFFFHSKFQHYKLPTERDENHSSGFIHIMQEISNAATSPFSFETMSPFNDVSIVNNLSLLI